METLRKTTEELDEKIVQIELKLTEQKEAGRAALQQRNKIKVAQHARAVRALNSQMSQLSAMKANLFERELAEEMAALTKSYTDAIAGALKQNKKGGFDVDKAISTIDSAQDQLEQLNEFSEAVRDATESSSSRADEDDLEALFREEYFCEGEAQPETPVQTSSVRFEDLGPPVETRPISINHNHPRQPPPNVSVLDKKLAGIRL